MSFYNDGKKWTDGASNEVKSSPIQANTYQIKSVPRVVAEEAYKEYVARYGKSQSLERLEERGGFCGSEIAILLFQRIQRLEQNK